MTLPLPVKRDAIAAIVAVFDEACGNARKWENRDEARYLIDDAYNAWCRKWEDPRKANAQDYIAWADDSARAREDA